MAILRAGAMAIAREPTGTAELDETLAGIVQRAAELAEADVVVARLADESGALVAHAVHTGSEAVRAELESSRIPPEAAPAEEQQDLELLPAQLRLAAERISAVGVLQLPVRDNGDLVGSLELLRTRSGFGERQCELARAAADEVALARRAFWSGEARRTAPDALELVGDALAAAADETQAAEQVASLAAEATGAAACLLWRYEAEGAVLDAAAGIDADEPPT